MSRAIALYECAADDPAELSFPIGAILVDVEPAEDPDWFVGRIEGTNAVGLFPGNYVRFEAAKSRSATNTPRDPPALTFTSSSDDEQPQFPRPLTRLPDKPEPKLDAAALRNALKDKTDHLAAMAREKLSSSGATTSSTVAPPSQNRSRAVSEQTSSVPPALPPRLPPRPSAPPLDPPQKSSTFPPTTHTRKDAVDVIAARKPSAGGSEVHLSISALAAKFSEQSAPEAPKRPALLQSNREVDPPPTPRRSTSNTPSPIPSAATTIRKPTTSGPAPPPPAPRKPANLRSPALPQQRSVTSPPAIPSLTTKTDSDDDNDPPASVKPSDLKRMWETRSTPNQQPLFATKSRPPPPPPPASKKQQSSNLETPPPLPRRAVSDSAASSNNAKGNPPRVPPRPKPHAQSVSAKIPADANRRYGTLFDQLASELDPADIASGTVPARSWNSASHGTKLGGTVVRKVWLRSGLDNKALGSIWQLVDTRAEGELDKIRFCIGMHLIDERLRGYPIPEELPRELQLLIR